MDQVHGTGVAVVDGPQEPAGARHRRPGDRDAAAWCCACWSPTACRCCWPTRRPAWSRAVHAGREGVRRGVLPAALSAMASLGARAAARHRAAGPGGVRRLLRGARGDAGRGRPGGARRPPCARARGHARPGPARRGWPSCCRGPASREVVHDPRCTVEDPPLFSHRRDGVTGRQAGLVWLDRVSGSRTAISRRTCAPSARASTPPRGPPAATRHRWRCSPSARPGRPTAVRALRRAGAGRLRREPGAGAARPRRPSWPICPLRWHFVGQLQRNKAAAVARLGAVVHSVDRAALAGPLDRVGRRRGPAGRGASSRSTSAARRATSPPAAGPHPATCPPWPTRSPRLRRAAAARPHGGRPARRGARAGVRPAGRRSPRGCGPTIRRRSTCRRA